MTKDFLSSEKKVFDSVHGFIPFDEYEKELIDSLPFQRLHYIHQMGCAYLVYPGATHTRFEHSLGVMAVATLMFEKICKSIRPDVFHFVPRKGSGEYLYWRRVLRLAALCHDLGHLPFSHVAEKDLLPEKGHEEWTIRIMESPQLAPVWDRLRKAPAYHEDLINRNIVEDIQKVAVGEAHWDRDPFTPWERIVSEIITGSFFGADRIDYLLRDAKSTGVGYGLFDYHQLIETLRVLPVPEEGSEAFELGIDENGLESCEALLLARHFMHRRVYQYSSVKAYNFHLRRFLSEVYGNLGRASVQEYLDVSDTDVITALSKAAKDPRSAGHEDARCVIFRQHRFRAIQLPASITASQLEAFRAREGLKKGEMEWEFPEACSGPAMTFPVSRRHVTICRAHECSELLLKMPETAMNWVYISPKHDLALVNFLESPYA